MLVNGDTKRESNGTFTVTLSAPTNATIGTGTGTGTITNDDAVPTISINDVTVTEGNAGVTQAIFTVSLSNQTDLAVAVAYQTADNHGDARQQRLPVGERVAGDPGQDLIRHDHRAGDGGHEVRGHTRPSS